ncbi:MAG: alpha/beta hydrolase [Buchananella hordeovulneris]|nr:alpha/beta hydrolase [Buchananella hordeovulneris]
MFAHSFARASAPTPDGRTLSTLVAGTDKHAVFLETGLGVSAHYWAPLMRLLAPDFTVVAYDRAGIGASSPDPAERDLDRLAADLQAVVGAHEFDSAVVVGHSWGGPIVRTWAANHASAADRVSLVLVDPTDEHLLPFFGPASVKLQVTAFRACSLLGLSRLLVGAFISALPKEDKRVALDACASRAAGRELAQEMRHLRSGLMHLAQQRATAPALFTTIVTGGTPRQGERQKVRDAINAAHASAAALLPNGELVLAPDSGHNIPLTEPDVIERVIRSHFART